MLTFHPFMQTTHLFDHRTFKHINVQQSQQA